MVLEPNGGPKLARRTLLRLAAAAGGAEAIGLPALAADPAPFVHLANAYVGSTMGTLVNAAGVISAFGAQLACVVAANVGATELLPLLEELSVGPDELLAEHAAWAARALRNGPRILRNGPRAGSTG